MNETAHTPRLLGEMQGVVAALVLGGLGAIVKQAASVFDDDSENSPS